MAFICIDIGGTNTLIGLGNGDFNEVERMRSSKFLSNIEENVLSALEDAGYRKQEIDQVAVAAAGPMDKEKGVFYPPNLSRESELGEVQLQEPLEQFGDLKIFNDCSAAVIGEYFYGESAREMLYITVSSGIGLGAISCGELILGADGNFGEIGHMDIGGDLKCGCGGKGHWEAYCSGNRLPVMAEKLFDADFEDAVSIFEAYEKGDSTASKIIEKMQEVNERALANVINLYNPDKIVMGGPVALNHRELVFGEIYESLEEKCVNKTPEIVPAGLGDESVLHGLRAACNGDFSL